MLEPHRHRGGDAPQIDAQDLAGKAIYHEDLAASARGQSIIQQGPYTLAAGKAFVTFPQVYSSTTNLQVVLTTKTTNGQFLDSVAVSGFTVSGSGSDTGVYIAIGYK